MDIGVKDAYAFEGTKFNLVIGGVAPTLGTAELIASKFTFSASNVKKLLIVNNDLYLKINVPFSLVSQAFLDNLNITFLYDYSGFFSAGNGLEAFKNSNLRTFTSTSTLSLASRMFQNSKLTTYDAPLTTTLNRYVFLDCALLTSLDLPVCSSNLDTHEFKRATNLRYLNLPNIGSGGNAETFNGIATNGVGNFPAFLATSNAGNPHVNMTYLINRGWTINYI